MREEKIIMEGESQVKENSLHFKTNTHRKKQGKEKRRGKEEREREKKQLFIIKN